MKDEAVAEESELALRKKQIYGNMPVPKAVALMVGIVLILRLFKRLHFEKQS